jgi:hypothetical protein
MTQLTSNNLKISIWSYFVIAFYLMGSFLNLLAYESLQPVILSLVILSISLVVISFNKNRVYFKKTIFMLVFSICWFWSGIAAIFLQYFNDASQLGDAGNFYSLATSGDYISNIFDIQSISEGGAAILLWQYAYKISLFLGLGNGQYVGILINILCVSITSLVGLKIIVIIFGNDIFRIKRYAILFSACGIFWLFASLMLRDAMILLSISILIFYWIRYLSNSTATHLLSLVIVSIFFTVLLPFLRSEFFIVPLLFLLVGIFSYLVTPSTLTSKRMIGYVVFFIITIVIIGVSYHDLIEIIQRNIGRYSEKSSMDSNGISLGYTIIVNQSILVRTVLGSIYLFIFPIPFWVGFQLDSVYPLFKTLHVLFMYFLVPMLYISLIRIFKSKEFRTKEILFLLFISIGFTVSIAITSLEGRHFGIFIFPMLLLALIPDFTIRSELSLYKKYVFIYIILMIIIHMIWAVMKL